MVDTAFLTWAHKSFTAATATRTYEARQEEHVSVKDFGATGDGATDDTAAIQAAIDYALYHHRSTVYMPEGTYKTTNTIHLGYGWIANSPNFNQIKLVGAGMYYLQIGSEFEAYTRIAPTFKDRPVINIQGARGSEVHNLAITGPTAFGTDPYFWTFEQRATASSYIPSGAQDNRYTPFCGICVDGYSGTLPASPYPMPTYPSWARTGASDGYGASDAVSAAMSSDIVIDRVLITYCNVGIMVQPRKDGNGDFMKFTNCQIMWAKAAIAFGNTQARNNDLQNLNCYGIHTVIDGTSYGNQAGNITGNWSNMQAMASYQMLTGSTNWVYPISITNLYMENGMRLGPGMNQGSNITFRNCHFYNYSETLSGGALTGFYREPFWGGDGTFEGCSFYGHAIYHFPGQVRFRDCYFSYDDNTVHGTTFSASLRACLNAFGQIFMGTPSIFYPEPDPLIGCCLRLNGRGHTEQEWMKPVYSGYDKYEGVCMWSVGTEYPTRWRYDLAPMFNMANSLSNITMNSPSFSNDTFTFDPGGQRFYRPGDVIRGVGGGSGMWWYVESQDAGSPYIVRCRALTYMKWNGTTYTALVDPSVANWYVYYPINVLDLDPGALAAPVFMQTVQGDATVSFVDATGAAVNRPSIVTVNSKPLWCGSSAAFTGNTVPFPSLTTVASVDTQSLEMSAVALVSGTWAFAPGIKRVK